MRAASRLMRWAPIAAPLAWPRREGSQWKVVPQGPPTRNELWCSTTGDREFAYIHEHNWNDKMWNIAGMVDFQSLMEEGCYLLKGVGADIIHRLSFGAKVFARKGTVLIEEGSENSALFVVGHGTLKVSVKGEKISTLGPGQVVGLYTMLKGTNASATVTVSSDLAYVLELRHSHFQACLEDEPSVKQRMQVILEQREAQNKAAEMVHKKTIREV